MQQSHPPNQHPGGSGPYSFFPRVVQMPGLAKLTPAQRKEREALPLVVVAMAHTGTGLATCIELSREPFRSHVRIRAFGKDFMAISL